MVTHSRRWRRCDLVTIGLSPAASCEADEARVDVGRLIAEVVAIDSVDGSDLYKGLLDGDIDIDALLAMRDSATDVDRASDTDEAPPGNERTPYSQFVARGVKALIDLAVLAGESQGAEGVDAVTTTARRLERWADG